MSNLIIESKLSEYYKFPPSAEELVSRHLTATTIKLDIVTRIHAQQGDYCREQDIIFLYR